MVRTSSRLGSGRAGVRRSKRRQASGPCLDRGAGLVVLIANVADELLEQVLEGHDASESSGVIFHHREVAAAAKHLEQEVVTARGGTRFSHGAESNLIAAGVLQHVERVDHADHVVERIAINGYAAVTRLRDEERAL